MAVSNKVKPALTINQQIDLLKSKGLLFRDEGSAYRILQHTNYYKLRGYFIDFYKIDNVFCENICFEDIYNCYLFDLTMHKSLLPIMETVEVSIKTIFAYYLANRLGPLAYLNREIYKYPDNYENVKNNASKYILNHKKSKIVQKHENNYNGDYPIWVWIEFLSFGDVSLLLTSLKDEYIDEINNYYFLFHKRVGKSFIRSWYRSISKFRNICSHYERLYSTKLLETPPKITNQKEITDMYNTGQNTELFYYILVANMFCPNKKIVYSFIEDLKKNLMDYSNISINDNYGFPADWEEILLKFNGYYIQYLF